MTWAVGDGTQVRLSTALSAVAPSATAALIGFVCPQQHRLRRAEVARVGFLVAPHHYCGQDIPATGTLHQHSPAQALFAGFRIITPHHHFTVSQPANAKEATALIRLLHACVTVAGSLAQL